MADGARVADGKSSKSGKSGELVKVARDAICGVLSNFKLHNKRTNGPTDQRTNGPTDQRTNQPTNRPTDQLTN